MKYIADLHIHSLFSRATSKQSTLSGLFAWARVKGINIVGTGDFTHPGWFRHLKENLIPAEPGLFQLNRTGCPCPSQVIEVFQELAESNRSDARDEAKADPVFNVFLTHFQSNAILA